MNQETREMVAFCRSTPRNIYYCEGRGGSVIRGFVEAELDDAMYAYVDLLPTRHMRVEMAATFYASQKEAHDRIDWAAVSTALKALAKGVR